MDSTGDGKYYNPNMHLNRCVVAQLLLLFSQLHPHRFHKRNDEQNPCGSESSRRNTVESWKHRGKSRVGITRAPIYTGPAPAVRPHFTARGDH